MARYVLAAGKNIYDKVTPTLASRGRYFLRLTIEITAQSIITKVNKSAYVIIGTSSLQNIQQLTYRPIGSHVKYIIEFE